MNLDELGFSTDFECGCGTNFTKVSKDTYSFEIPPDNQAEARQWFFFQVENAAGRDVEFQLSNADKTNVPAQWSIARAVYSADGGATWHRMDQGHYDVGSGVYTFRHQPRSSRELIASHFPYSLQHLQSRLDSWCADPRISRSSIGKSVEGRSIDLLRIDNGSGKKKRGVWLTGRQHAAETSASFTLDGCIDFLLSDDPRAKALLEHTTFNIVPMINPDGVVRGHYRCNARGINLNRFWNKPDETDSPEVLAVTQAIGKWVEDGNPFDFFIDFHSDSAAQEHYAFHGSPKHEPPSYIRQGKYYHDVVRFLNLIAQNAPEFLPGKGMMFNEDVGISYHHMREEYGVLAIIPEASYNRISHGSRAGSYADVEAHLGVGRAIGIALHDFFME